MRCSQPWAAQDLISATPDWASSRSSRSHSSRTTSSVSGRAPSDEVALHQRGVKAEVGRGEQADGAGALQVAVALEQLGGRKAGVVVVHLRSSLCSWSDAPT